MVGVNVQQQQRTCIFTNSRLLKACAQIIIIVQTKLHKNTNKFHRMTLYLMEFSSIH